MPTTRNAVAGSNTRVAYEIEDTYASTPGSPTWKVPGWDTRVPTLEATHNLQKLFAPDQREATETVKRVFDGSLTTEFILANPNWIPTVIAPGDGASPETFSGDFPTSAVFVIGDEVRDKELVINGCVNENADITCDVPGEFRVSLTYEITDAERVSGIGTTGPTDQPRPSVPPMSFVDAALTIGGTTKQLMDTTTLSIANNPRTIPDYGSNLKQDYSVGERAVDLSYTNTKQASPPVDEVTDLFGGGSSADGATPSEGEAVFKADNGSESVEFTVALAQLNSLSETGLGDPDSDVAMETGRIGKRDTANTTPAIEATASGF